MKINGVQNLTLLDYPGKTACTVFLAGCNMRCPFCHNSTLVLEAGQQPRIEEEEFFTFLQKRKKVLDGVAITGGEPTLRAELPLFIEKVKALGYSVKLDTNGTNPQMLRELIEKGLIDYAAMDIKSRFEDYPAVSGKEDIDLAPIKESMAILRERKITFEFRTTVVKGLHTAETLIELARTIGEDPWFLQQFKDSGSIICPGLEPIPDNEMKEILKAVLPFAPSAALRGVD